MVAQGLRGQRPTDGTGRQSFGLTKLETLMLCGGYGVAGFACWCCGSVSFKVPVASEDSVHSSGPRSTVQLRWFDNLVALRRLPRSELCDESGSPTTLTSRAKPPAVTWPRIFDTMGTGASHADSAAVAANKIGQAQTP